MVKRHDGYAVRDGAVYWRHDLVAKADPATFEILNRTWARDAQRVYSVGRQLRGADRDTFRLLNDVFARDAAAIYYLGGRLEDADAATFEVLDDGTSGINGADEAAQCVVELPGGSFARDARGVFYYAQTVGNPSRLRGADRDSFVVMRAGYARDRKYVYYEKTRVQGADPASFELLSSYYGRDRQAVYYLTRRIDGAHRDSFRVLATLYGADDLRVYHWDRPVDGADPATFQPPSFSGGGGAGTPPPAAGP
jgi:DKNYY family protein